MNVSNCLINCAENTTSNYTLEDDQDFGDQIKYFVSNGANLLEDVTIPLIDSLREKYNQFIDFFLQEDEKNALFSIFQFDNANNSHSLVNNVDQTENQIDETKKSDENQSSFTDNLSQLNEHFQNLWKVSGKAFGMLIFGRFVVTFDSAIIELTPSRCTSLLLGELIDKKISIKLSYNHDLNHVLILIIDKHEVQFYPRVNQVRLNSKLIDLPIVLNNIRINRKSNSIEAIIGHYKENNLTIECFINNDLCTFEMSKKYENNTFGLLGNFDGDQSNDYTMSESGLKTFNSIKNQLPSKSCRLNLNPLAGLKNLTKQSSKATRLCKQLRTYLTSQVAEDSGVVVDLDNYFKICIKTSLSTDNNQSHDDTKLVKIYCNMAAAYVLIAKQHSIELLPPLQCLTCDNNLRFGGRQFIEPFGVLRLTDVIYVVHESTCMMNVINSLSGMSKLIEMNNLAQNDLHETRFGLISFNHLNGEPQPQVRGHSIDGDLLFTADMVARAVNRLNFANTKSGHKMDIYEALAKATQYPFRKGSSKNIVLMTCESCSNEAKSRFDYNDLRSILLNQGIILHLISNQPLSVPKINRKQITSIIGLDSDLVFFLKSENEFLNHLHDILSLKDKISIPNDVCIALATISGGSYFPIPKKNLARKWQFPVAKRLSSNLEPKFCQFCDCILDENMINSKILCKPCKPLDGK